MNTSVRSSSMRTGMETICDRLGSIIRSATPSSSSVSRATVRNCWHAIRYVGELMKGLDAGLAGGIADIHTSNGGEEPSGGTGTTELYAPGGRWSQRAGDRRQKRRSKSKKR